MTPESKHRYLGINMSKAHSYLNQSFGGGVWKWAKVYGLYAPGTGFPQSGYVTFIILYLFFTTVHSQTTASLLFHN